MSRFGLLPTTDRHLYRSILLTLLLACLLIAATLWVYQQRIQRLQRKLNEGAAPAVSHLMKGKVPSSRPKTEFFMLSSPLKTNQFL